MKLQSPRVLRLILPAATILSAALAAIQPGPYLNGWIGFFLLFMLGFVSLYFAWQWAGGDKLLAWMITATLVLRLGAGVLAYVVLPINGYPEPDDKAGFIFTDAHRRDDQAWELGSSGRPLWSAFDKTFYTDQYGGLLGLSALSYRIFSPDSHRPLLILSLAALTAALGVPFFLRASRLLWDRELAILATWLYVIYPESVLTGGAQMREPFLLTFIAIAWWGFVQWIKRVEGRLIAWLAIGFLGMVLVSPAIAVAVLILMGGWIWLKGRSVHVPVSVWIAATCVLLVSVAFLAWSLASPNYLGASPLGIIPRWFLEATAWVIYQLERGSGQVQNVFSKLTPAMQFLFVVGYGIAQPVLPPAFLEPTTFFWHIIAILRAAGWYLLLPFLLYAPFAIKRANPGAERRLWIWIWVFCWIWIVICAIRGGGDQWDNPRYRLIFLGFQTLLAAYAWRSWRTYQDRWLPRILIAEVLCILFFGQWYLARYYLIGIHFPIMIVLTLSISSLMLVLLGGYAWDRWRGRG